MACLVVVVCVVVCLLLSLLLLGSWLFWGCVVCLVAVVCVVVVFSLFGAWLAWGGVVCVVVCLCLFFAWLDCVLVYRFWRVFLFGGGCLLVLVIVNWFVCYWCLMCLLFGCCGLFW